jgi:hypothetical protein
VSELDFGEIVATARAIRTEAGLVLEAAERGVADHGRVRALLALVERLAEIV